MVKQMISFTEPQRTFLKREAKRLGISMADLVRRIVDAHIASKVKLLAVLACLVSVVGCGASPTAPSASRTAPSATATTITVDIFVVSDADAPIAGAAVLASSVCRLADNVGHLAVTAAPGQQLTMTVGAEGFDTLSLSSVVTVDTTWRMHLTKARPPDPKSPPTAAPERCHP